MAKKPLAICLFCDEQPCVCGKPKKNVARTPSMQGLKPVAAVMDEIDLVAPQPRAVRKITAPAPGVTTLSVPEPAASLAPRRIERNLATEDVVDIIAIQALISGGLVTVQDNPHLGGIAAMKLTPQERARGWRAQL